MAPFKVSVTAFLIYVIQSNDYTLLDTVCYELRNRRTLQDLISVDSSWEDISPVKPSGARKGLDAFEKGLRAEHSSPGRTWLQSTSLFASKDVLQSIFIGPEFNRALGEPPQNVYPTRCFGEFVEPPPI